MKSSKTLCVILCLLLLLTGCAGMGDWTYELQENYQIMRINGDSVVLAKKTGEGLADTVVDRFVSMVAYTENLIFVQQTDAQLEPENSNQEVRYFIVFTEDGTVEGPMTHAEFEDTVAALLPNTTIQWYSTTDGSLQK